jgi:hypothetical protein
MTLVDIFFAAAAFGGWLIAAGALLAAGCAVIWAGRWIWRIAVAAGQWLRDTRQQPDTTDDISDTELADVLAIWVDDYQAKTDYSPQAGLDRLRDEINDQRQEDGQ